MGSRWPMCAERYGMNRVTCLLIEKNRKSMDRSEAHATDRLNTGVIGNVRRLG
jgi:hypothetical protein